LTAVALVAALVLAPAAVAKQHKDDDATATASATATAMTASPTASPTAMASGSPTAAVGGALPATGGSSGFALLAGALLLGSSVLSYAILRRSP
jgi:hypothetical protein